MNPILSQAFGAFVEALAEEVVKNIFKTQAVPADLIKQPAANDNTVGSTQDTPGTTSKDKVAGETSGKANKTSKADSSDVFTPEDLRAEALALINLYAPTHGPAIRKALADVGAKRLSEVTESDITKVLEALKGLANA